MTNTDTPPVVERKQYQNWLFIAAGICFVAPIAACLCIVVLLTSVAAIGISEDTEFSEAQAQLETSAPAVEQPVETIPTSVTTGLPVGPATPY